MDELKNPERQLSSIAHMVSRGAEIHPDRIAIDDLLRSCRLTYLELDRRISQLARALRGLGLKKGDFLGVMLWNEHAVVETIFACARAGIIVAPLNVRLLAEEVVPYVNFHGCKAIVTNADFEEKFEKADATTRISTSGNEGWLEYESLISGGKWRSPDGRDFARRPRAACFHWRDDGHEQGRPPQPCRRLFYRAWEYFRIQCPAGVADDHDHADLPCRWHGLGYVSSLLACWHSRFSRRYIL